MLGHEAEQDDVSVPMWAAFGDLMACLFGLFVLFFAWVVTFDVALVADLETERAERVEATSRLSELQRVLAGPLRAGTVTLVDGRIGIRGSVLFQRNSAELSDKGRALLKELSTPLSTYLAQQQQALMVSGFTDDLRLHGMRQFRDNWELSAQRALTVVRSLVEAGVSEADLFAAGFGKNHPIAPNASEDARAQNRRVELSPVPRPRVVGVQPTSGS